MCHICWLISNMLSFQLKNSKAVVEMDKCSFYCSCYYLNKRAVALFWKPTCVSAFLPRVSFQLDDPTSFIFPHLSFSCEGCWVLKKPSLTCAHCPPPGLHPPSSYALHFLSFSTLKHNKHTARAVKCEDYFLHLFPLCTSGNLTKLLNKCSP